MLCEDPLFSRIENMFFLDVMIEMELFVILHSNRELSNKIIIHGNLLGWIYKELLNVSFYNELFWLNLHLDIFILIFKLLKEGKWHRLFMLEIDLRPLNIILNILNSFSINLHYSCETLLHLLFEFCGKFLTFISGQSMSSNIIRFNSWKNT